MFGNCEKSPLPALFAARSQPGALRTVGFPRPWAYLNGLPHQPIHLAPLLEGPSLELPGRAGQLEAGPCQGFSFCIIDLLPVRGHE